MVCEDVLQKDFPCTGCPGILKVYRNGEKIRFEDIVSELSLKNFLWTLCALSCCFGITFCMSGHSFQIVS